MCTFEFQMTKMPTTEHSYFYEYILKGKKKKDCAGGIFFFLTPTFLELNNLKFVLTYKSASQAQDSLEHRFRKGNCLKHRFASQTKRQPCVIHGQISLVHNVGVFNFSAVHQKCIQL